MDRLLLVAALVVAAVVVAQVLQRRRPEPPTQGRWQVPTQLDRADFDGADRPWLVVVFTSTTCESCAKAVEKASALESPEVAFQAVPYQERKDLHQRYAVEVVPAILAVDPDGVVQASFVGTPTATDLWAAVAEARNPGSSPEPDLGRPPELQ
ncbi:MAG TPA: thioredoxin family protein [Acidimicrobiales bacterium]|nr:thioredoxin family protein [Acidimicrobiales bacterium]